MLALFRDSATQAASLIPKPDPGPDWLALIDLLQDLQQPADAGETNLTTAEAAKLRDLGWSASKGRWYSPTIPWEHVRLYSLLWHLADNLDPASRPIAWHRKRAVFHQISSIDPLSDDEHRFAPSTTPLAVASAERNCCTPSPGASPLAYSITCWVFCAT